MFSKQSLAKPLAWIAALLDRTRQLSQLSFAFCSSDSRIGVPRRTTLLRVSTSVITTPTEQSLLAFKIILSVVLFVNASVKLENKTHQWVFTKFPGFASTLTYIFSRMWKPRETDANVEMLASPRHHLAFLTCVLPMHKAPRKAHFVPLIETNLRLFAYSKKRVRLFMLANHDLKLSLAQPSIQRTRKDKVSRRTIMVMVMVMVMMMMMMIMTMMMMIMMMMMIIIIIMKMMMTIWG